MITRNIWGLLALAADTDTTITSGAAASESISNGSEPSAGTTDAHVPSNDAEPDYEALLNVHGSKLDEFGGALNVDLEAEIPTGKTPAAKPAEEETPAATHEETEEDETGAVVPVEKTGEAPKGPANSFRLNLKDAADADAKRRLIHVLRDEPNLDSAEAIRRAGILLTPAAAPAAETKTEPSPAPAPADDPRKSLRDEIARLKAEGDKATKEFQYGAARDLDVERFEKQRVLDRLDDQAAQREQSERARAARTQAQQTDDAAVNSWKEVEALYPDVKNKQSEFYQTLQSTIDQKQKSDPGFFKNPDWPEMLSLPLARKLKLAASGSAPAAPAKPVVAPKKALTPVPPAPAPGGAASGGDATTWNPERESIEDYLDRCGTKIGPQPTG